MKFEAIISNDYKQNPSIKICDDGTDITFHCYTENTDELKKLWREETIFNIEVNNGDNQTK